jgi:hypothetical protein
MKEFIQKLETMRDNIKYDLSQDWNDNKIQDSLDLSKLDIAIALLKEVKNENNAF